jgi:hypothetical protein
LRLVETHGTSVSLVLGGDLLGRDVFTTLAPYEVQTLLVPDDPEGQARAVDIAELGLPARDGSG